MPLNLSLSFPQSAAVAVVAAGLKVLRYELREAMSELFELTIEVLSTDPAIGERDVVGQPITVEFGDEPFLGEIQGIVRALVQRTAVPTGDSKYELVIVPPLWLATRRHDRRIFQNKSVPEIVDAVLGDPTYAGRIAAPAKLLTRACEAREYVVQYDETDYAFLSRILADEGIASFFDHANGSTWTLIQDTALSAPSLTGSIPFSDPSHQNPVTASDRNTPHIQTAVIISRVETSAVAIRDYDFEKPDRILEAKSAVQAEQAYANEANLEDYTFAVGKFTEQTPGDLRSRAIRDADRNERRRILCTSSFALPPGTRMPLVDHPREDMNRDFVVVRAFTRVEFGAARVHELEFIEIANRFRPTRRPKSKVHGAQTAFVVGAPGEEIDVDRYGRVEVEFRWDRRDLHTGGTSRRVRVAQGWAGAGFGFVMLPRVNEEVIVSYLDGDPDQPIVVGRVHNASVTSPLNLPADKAVSVWRSKSTPKSEGFNQILMDDAAGAERLEQHAQRDFTSSAGRNSATSVGKDQSTTVVGDRKTKIGGNDSLTVGGDADADITGALTVKADTMDFQAKSFFNVNAEGNMYLRAAGDMELKAGLNYHLRSGGAYLECTEVVQIVAPHVNVFAGTRIHLQVGGSLIEITEGGIKIASSGDVNVNGANVKLNC